jgi:RNA polymerase sigma-70 factor (ECF subfamily)
MNQAEDAVQRFLEGDEEAFSRLVRQWEVKVYNLAWRFLGNREDAQDIAQETFLSVFKSIRQLRDPKSFQTWLYRIALNHCRAHWRRQTQEVSLDDSVSGDDGNIPEPIAAGQENRDPLEVTDLLRKALTGISEHHRAAIILKEYVGLNLEEVAVVMDCPLSTAKSRLYHGLRGVQRNLKRIGVKGLQAGS